jgi:class 3 adenylate cyclase
MYSLSLTFHSGQSLFPAEIRDRLFDNEEPDSKKNAHLIKNMSDPQKLRLKNYLTEEELPSKGGKTREKGADGVETKPIADLFPNTTVMFADISGFTAWSSVREPSQVFTLLETVYKAFDINAKRHRVFKVETVGDCYGKRNFFLV